MSMVVGLKVRMVVDGVDTSGVGIEPSLAGTPERRSCGPPAALRCQTKQRKEVKQLGSRNMEDLH